MSPQVPGAYRDAVPEETGERRRPAAVRTPPPPGTEVAGPPLVEYVEATRAAVRAELQAYLAAVREGARRTVRVVTPFACTAAGHARVQVYQVPEGMSAWLVGYALEGAGRTPISASLPASYIFWTASDPGAEGATPVPGRALAIAPTTLERSSGGSSLRIPQVEFMMPPAAPLVYGPETVWLQLVGEAAIAGLACALTSWFLLDRDR